MSSAGIAPVDLPGPVATPVAPASGGPVYVQVGGEDGPLLCAVDLDGSLRWSRAAVRACGRPRVAPDGGVWLEGRGVLHETLPTGDPGRRVELDRHPGHDVGAFVILPDGFVVAWQSSPYRGVRVERLDGRGRPRWSTELPVPAGLSYAGVVEMSAESGWRPVPARPWAPADLLASWSEALLVSGDRVLATFFEVSSGIGMSFCVDLGTGDHLWQTPPVPIGDLAIAGPGSFLVGVQGYGAFETLLYNGDGAVVLQWPSHGRPLVSSRGRIRMVELDNDPSRTLRIRRLHRDASMTDGPVLTGYHTIGPVLAADGRAAFWRDGRLQVVDRDLTVRTLHADPAWSGTDRMLLLDGGVLAFVLNRGDERRLVFARTGLPPMDGGAWPCGEGNLQANPVL
ncbi:MAG TPA: hypothetical protein VHJ17_00425 [Thermomonospora sp.]|nr:hypothetical protein [Thermomonospora sp.]